MLRTDAFTLLALDTVAGLAMVGGEVQIVNKLA
jgi:hypothetical protein